jgi:hypothetical protein
VPEQEDAGKRDGGGSGLEEFLAEKVRALSDIVADVRGEIARRARLSNDLVGRIYQQYLYLKTKLIELYSWSVPANRAVEQRRLRLEGILDVLKREGRNEEVKCTEEIARLKGELWRWLKEYLDVAVRTRLVMGDGKRT